MEEKKTLKIKKPRLIIFALAIAFAIMGFIDLKVNAAESLVEDIPYEEQYLKVSYFTYDYVNKTYRLRDWDLHTPHTRIALYYGDFTDNAHDPDNTNNVIQNTGKGYRLCVLRDPNNSRQYWETGSYSEVHYDKDMNVKSSDSHEYGYSNTLSHAESMPTSSPDWKCIGSFKGQEKVENLEIDTNIPIFTDWDCLREYLETGFYDPSGVVIDYSQFQTDDTMPYVDNIYGNRLCFETLPDYAYYDYFTWKNNTSFQVQVERTPIVHFYKGFFNSNLIKAEYMGFVPYKILDSGTSKLNNVSDVARFHQQYPKEHAWFRSVIDTADYNYDYVQLGFGYRLRYVDISTQKASLWIYIIPTYAVGEVGQGYLKYIQYADGSLSDYMDITGLQKSWNVFDSDKIDSVEDVENVIDKIIQYVDNRNEFKEEFGVGDNVSTLPPSSSGSIGNNNGNIVTDVDVEDATTWLHSVATFIKGTPSFIGSVMSFLPEPVRYGMFVCLFLGVIASGYAIVKALI